MKQKLIGLALITIGILAPFVCNGDGTAGVFLVPVGAYLALTREKII